MSQDQSKSMAHEEKCLVAVQDLESQGPKPMAIIIHGFAISSFCKIGGLRSMWPFTALSLASLVQKGFLKLGESEAGSKSHGVRVDIIQSYREVS